jgi:hypothetical protein
MVTLDEVCHLLGKKAELRTGLRLLSGVDIKVFNGILDRWGSRSGWGCHYRREGLGAACMVWKSSDMLSIDQSFEI